MFLYGIGLRFGFSQIYKQKRSSVLIINEIVIQIGNHNYWLWIPNGAIDKSIIGIQSTEETCL